jgi:DNA polymerase-3 subunit epsilon
MLAGRDLLRVSMASPLLSPVTLPDLGEKRQTAPSCRQVVLDLETTGIDAGRGHRIVEIGGVELVERRLTGRSFHRYINPERPIGEGPRAVHGLTRERLEHEPKFAEIARDFLGFIDGSDLVIHNASFDIGFLDAEFARLEPLLSSVVQNLCPVIDTLTLARMRHPGQRNNLAVLCKRYGIDTAHPGLDGALLDARITADVFLTMTGGSPGATQNVAIQP